MSKRVKKAALEAWPVQLVKTNFDTHEFDENIQAREVYIQGYEQAEKDMIERAAEWIKTHWREYLLGPDADGCICFGYWENDFRKAMEEE